MWFPQITANGVLAFATLIYGAATTALVISGHKDRQQRHVHFQHEQREKKLEMLYSAFCEAWGYTFGLSQRSYDAPVTATDAAKVTEALIRLEVQLRLNQFDSLADDFQRAIFNRAGREEQLSIIGKALGLLHQSSISAPVIQKKAP